ncbi:MAG: hypothetical protein IPG54_12660 [Sphingomonadales bacterium]|nr:hypothetical protein [Sphingomonadales bacterium]MBK9004535.1 hypothetical protein [Sphingomonadales bacterium]MBK9269722.1 hypothetical protein [Sphingomonadales bacterium]MBP6435194.1 hypothetical protein [Sphingorhabdus sp.]
MNTRSTLLAAASCALLVHISPVQGQVVANRAISVPAQGATYADIADLVVISPLILDAQIRKVTKLPETQTLGVPANIQRVVIDADVTSLIRGADGFAARARFLLDVPKDAKGKIPKLQKRRYFLLGSKVAGTPGMLKLSRPDALVEWSAENDATLRAITREAVQVDAPQAVSGISGAFHTQGTVLGEGETQIFLRTGSGQPISVSVLSRPGQAKRWAVSTGDVIDESAVAPSRNTLLWYRLACSLPRTLDPRLVESGEAKDIANAQTDYRFVVESLGPCGRTRPVTAAGQ